jgi:RimJ/RimL family protein N-acetyltransferase/uncharacterized glyoxalase superfamily protein PhnB
MDRPELTTERLWLRPLTVDDAGDLHVAYGDPECLRFWHHPPSASSADTEREVAHMVDHEDQWAIGAVGDDEVLGYVGFVDALAPGARTGFGYLVRRSVWGRGYAAEAGRAALAYGFETVGIATAELWIQRDNVQSRRVAAKLGADPRTETQLHGLPHVVHGLTAVAWRGEPEPPPAHYGAEPILAVTDVAAAVQWWVDVVGFRAGFVYGDPPTHAGVLPADAWTGGPRVQLTSRSSAEAGGAMVYVTVSDVDVLARRGADAGATILTPLGDRPWGVREIELADPDGNRIRLGAG